MDHTELNFTTHSFGCKVNTYDTGLIQKNLATNGYSHTSDDKSKNLIHVLNTCAVTSEATQQAVRLIRKIKSQQPFATVVVTGCAAQVDTGAFENLVGADLVVANSHKGLLPQIISDYYKGKTAQKVFKSNIFKKEDLEIGGGEEHHHTRSFLKIQDGCNSFCSFCIIPYARGKSRSIPVNVLVDKINDLSKSDVKEVVLTGVHIGDYEDGALKIEDLVESILNKTKIPRIRLSSLEPIELTERLLQLYTNPRMCPHFHMSIQSTDTNVLKEMKRKYGESEVRYSLDQIKTKIPNSFVGLDVIAGFPTETDEQFEEVYKTLTETQWTRLHVFPYSERPGTKAAIIPQIPFSLRKERAARLRELSLHRYQSEALKQVGTIKKGLVLSKLSQNVQAVAHDYWSLNLSLDEETHKNLKNTVVDVLVESVKVMNGEVILNGKRVDYEI